MFRYILKLLDTLDKKDKAKLYLSIITLTLVAAFELVGLALIAPYASLVFDTESSLSSNQHWKALYSLFTEINHADFVFYIGLFIAAFIFVGNIFSMISIFIVNKLSCYFGARLSVSLLDSYLNKSYLFHKEINSAVLINNITQQCQRVVNGVFMPLMLMTSKIIMIILIGGGMFFVNPFVTIIATCIICLFYVSLFILAKAKLTDIGKSISVIYETQIKVLTESLAGIKIVKLNALGGNKVKEFSALADDLANNNYLKVSIGQSIRYIVEGVLFAVIAIVLAFISKTGQSLGDILSTLVLLSLAGYKLLPSFQVVFHSLATIKSEINAFLKFESHLVNSNQYPTESVSFDTSISFEEVCFSYPDKNKVLNSLNIEVNKGEKIGVVGTSGGGKSTFIDVLLGLLPPESGSIKVNETTIINQGSVIDWENSVGYVPQEIILVDGTIASNIAFGEDHIDESKVHYLLNACGLTNFVSELDEGIHTKVGERGLKLSGGQRQRVGIARALYHEPKLLVLDEATSALDSVTENELNNSISSLKGQITQVVIAHRVTTLIDCDRIYIFDKGKVSDMGTYDQLISSNSFFESLAGRNL